MFDASTLTSIVSVILGAVLIVLSMRRGPIRERYGNSNRLII
jgi:hypothetical protein